MKTVFADALDDKRWLRPEYLKEKGFSSRIFPDYIDRAEFVTLGGYDPSATSAADIVIHHAEYGETEQVLSASDVATAWELVFSLSHEDMIIEFLPAKLFLWLPAGEHMYVVFGDRVTVEKLGSIDALMTIFREYVEDSGLTEQGRRFLYDCAPLYSI